MTSDSRRFKKLKRVFVGANEESATETSVSGVVVERRGVRLRLADLRDRTGAEEHVGSFLFVDEKDAIRPPKGAFFIHELVGLNVVEEDGAPVGVMKDVLKLAANDVYVIERNGKDVLLPAVREFIRKIDIEARTMTVRLIEGLLDEGGGNDAD